jgi:hypothetical protein
MVQSKVQHKMKIVELVQTCRLPELQKYQKMVRYCPSSGFSQDPFCQLLPRWLRSHFHGHQYVAPPRYPKCIHDIISHYGDRCFSHPLFFLSLIAKQASTTIQHTQYSVTIANFSFDSTIFNISSFTSQLSAPLILSNFILNGLKSHLAQNLIRKPKILPGHLPPLVPLHLPLLHLCCAFLASLILAS